MLGSLPDYVMLGSLPIWCSRAAIQRDMSQCFQEIYPKTRVILDCTQIHVQTPTSEGPNSETYSNYAKNEVFV